MTPEQIIEETPRFINGLKEAFYGEGWGTEHREAISIAHNMLMIIKLCAEKHIEFNDGNITREQFDGIVNNSEEATRLMKDFLGE